jgi:septum site-determining protein MinD
MHEQKILAVSSGKGGVGKTTIAVNLGIALSMISKNIIIFDMDLAMPNIEILMSIKEPPVGLIDVIEGRLSLDKIIYRTKNIKIVPPGQFLDGFTNDNVKKIREIIYNTPQDIDFVILDMPPGREGIKILDEKCEVLIIVTPDSPAILDSLNFKLLAEKTGAKVIGAVLNTVRNEPGEITVEEVEKTLDLKVLALIPESYIIRQALTHENPFVYMFPDAEPTIELINLAKKLTGEENKKVVEAEDNNATLIKKILKAFSIHI